MRQPSPSFRVAIFNVKFSPNLGDGLLSECLEAELAVQLPGVSVETIDLAGREVYVEGNRLRGSALALLQHSPLTFRHLLVETLLGRKLRNELRLRWREKLREADAVIVGGGNLLSDADLNFPLKIDAAMSEAHSAGLRTAVYAVGVSDNWTNRGEALFRRAFTKRRLCFASVRDANSAEVWRRRFGPVGIIEPRIVCDPGVLTSIHFPRTIANARAVPHIGIGVMHPVAVKYHADSDTASARAQEDWYIALARACLERGWKVTVFTNGSSEDEAFLARMQLKFAAIRSAQPVNVLQRLRNPHEMALFISTLDLLMAHRLHSNIAAYSYAIPQIGFAWDRKLQSFLAQVGRSDCLCMAGIDKIESVIELAVRELRRGVEPGRHREVLMRAREDVGQLAAALLGAVRASPAFKRGTHASVSG